MRHYISLVLALFISLSSCAPPSTIRLLPASIAKTTLPPYNKGRGQTGSTTPTSFVELQLNLCNSGFAKCYANGASIPEGGELIYATGPNTVTINEVCSNDVPELQSYLGEAWPKDYTYSVFIPAVDKRTNGPYKCKNGFQYGSVVLGRVAAANWKGVKAYGGKYVSQDTTNEERIFVCAVATGDHLACATHLSSSSKPLALAQCKALMFDTIPYVRRESSWNHKAVVGGDFNLKYDPGDAGNAQNCVPAEWTRKGDSDVQHVVFSNDLKFGSSKKYGLTNTDHDGWLVKLNVA
ncbi:hypothetical protein N0V90_004464 [Kalmusia sp. IMI 367209]|nr:hypothetical protein N0V90_004464 [Kalmusia sp. IMI 367209]